MAGLLGGNLAAQSLPKDKIYMPTAEDYADCRGKVAGQVVRHTTSRGMITSLCMNSRKGLVAVPAGTRLR